MSNSGMEGDRIVPIPSPILAHVDSPERDVCDGIDENEDEAKNRSRSREEFVTDNREEV